MPNIDQKKLALDLEAMLRKVFLVLPVEYQALTTKLAHDDVSLEVLRLLQKEYPCLEKVSRVPSFANLISMVCEATTGHRIKYIFDAATRMLTSIKLEPTGNSLTEKKPEAPTNAPAETKRSPFFTDPEVDWDDEEEEEDPDEETGFDAEVLESEREVTEIEGQQG